MGSSQEIQFEGRSWELLPGLVQFPGGSGTGKSRAPTAGKCPGDLLKASPINLHIGDIGDAVLSPLVAFKSNYLMFISC